MNLSAIIAQEDPVAQTDELGKGPTTIEAIFVLFFGQ